MTVPEFLLAVYAVAGVWLLAIWRRPGRALWTGTAIAGMVLAAAVVIAGRHRIESVPMLVACAVLTWLAFRRSSLLTPPPSRRQCILAAAVPDTGTVLAAL